MKISAEMIILYNQINGKIIVNRIKINNQCLNCILEISFKRLFGLI